jgi:hypothetical protein
MTSHTDQDAARKRDDEDGVGSFMLAIVGAIAVAVAAVLAVGTLRAITGHNTQTCPEIITVPHRPTPPVTRQPPPAINPWAWDPDFLAALDVGALMDELAEDEARRD